MSVGGDGTALSASHFLDDSIPLLGINSDPGGAVDLNTKTDERRRQVVDLLAHNLVRSPQAKQNLI